MNKDLKRLILFASASIGFLEEDNNFKEVNCNKERKELIPIFKKMYEKIASKKIVSQSEVDKIIKAIQSKKLFFDIVTKESMQKEITISRKNRDTIAEHAINYACVKCTRNKKRCGLRTAFLEAGIPALHEEENKCCYKIC